MSEPLPPLSKVDSAVQGLSSSPPTDDLKKGHRRQSSLAPDVMNINELGKPYMHPIPDTANITNIACPDVGL